MMQQVARPSADHLRQLAISEYVADRVSYGNYAMFNKPLGNIYWESALRLKAVKAAVDPTIFRRRHGGKYQRACVALNGHVCKLRILGKNILTCFRGMPAHLLLIYLFPSVL